MRKIIVSIKTSLDSVMQDPQDFVFDYYGKDEELVKYTNDILNEADALIMGRATYEGFSAFWPDNGDDAMTVQMNSLPKYVASHTLNSPLTWNATLLKDVAAEVAALKQQDGKTILQYGIGELTNTLIDHGLVDEIQLLVFPVVISKGTRIFEHTQRVPMKLLDTKTFPSGVLLATYQPSTVK